MKNPSIELEMFNHANCLFWLEGKMFTAQMKCTLQNFYANKFFEVLQST